MFPTKRSNSGTFTKTWRYGFESHSDRTEEGSDSLMVEYRLKMVDTEVQSASNEV